MFNGNGGYSLADIAAATGGNRSNDNGWGGDGGAWWIIILFLFVFCGWGGNGFGGFGGGGASGALTRADLCQDMNFSNLEAGVRGISNGICSLGYDQLAQINGVQAAMASGFAGVDNAVCTLGYQNAALINGIENTINTTANAQNIMALQNQNALQAQLAQCCCDTKSMFADTKYQMATDTCAIQTSMANNTRDIIDSQNANTRAILDYLCQDKIATLTAENQALKLTASQQAQNAYLVDQLSPKLPVPAYQVPNPFVPYGYNNCGCGC